MSKSSIPPYDAASPIDQAREYHRLALESDRAGVRYRDERDQIIQSLWDSYDGTIASLARELGWTHQLACKVIHGRRKLAQTSHR